MNQIMQTVRNGTSLSAETETKRHCKITILHTDTTNEGERDGTAVAGRVFERGRDRNSIFGSDTRTEIEFLARSGAPGPSRSPSF